MNYTDAVGDRRCFVCDAHERDCPGEHRVVTPRATPTPEALWRREVEERKKAWAWRYRPDPTRSWFAQSIKKRRGEWDRMHIRFRAPAGPRNPDPRKVEDYLL